MEELELNRILIFLDDFTPIQRLLLTTSGTLQSALTALFQMPVLVEVVRQESRSGVIERDVNLKVGNQVVCHATSKVWCVDKAILRDIMECKIGLGQILTKHDRRPRFKMISMGQDGTSFWRVYRLEAPSVVYRIKETFPKELYG